MFIPRWKNIGSSYSYTSSLRRFVQFSHNSSQNSVGIAFVIPTICPLFLLLIFLLLLIFSTTFSSFFLPGGRQSKELFSGSIFKRVSPGALNLALREFTPSVASKGFSWESLRGLICRTSPPHLPLRDNVLRARSVASQVLTPSVASM